LRTLYVLVFCGALFTLSAKADDINVPASADRYSLAFLPSQGGRDLGRRGAVKGDRVEHFSRSVPVQTGAHGSKLADGGDFFASNPIWNRMAGDVTRSTSGSVNWTFYKAWNEPADSFLPKGGWVTDIAPVAVPANITPVPEPATLGLIAVALAAIALMRKRLA
jgi:hypothetical protein